MKSGIQTMLFNFATFSCVIFSFSMTAFGNPSQYQIGETWGPTRARDYEPKTPAILNMIQATPRLGGAGAVGTALYLGKYAGKHLIATNHHVSKLPYILSGRVGFNIINIFGGLNWKYQSWEEIDFAVVEITISPDNEEKMAKIVPSFDFETLPKHGQKLISWGYGGEQNSEHRMTINVEEQCKVFSQDNEIRLISDPDAINPLPYKVHSFAHGCDLSHGDSGGPLFDAQTNKVVGINWTTKTPKASQIQNDNNVNQLFENPAEATWTELSYAVPLSKIREILLNELREGKVKEELREAIRAWVSP